MRPRRRGVAVVELQKAWAVEREGGVWSGLCSLRDLTKNVFG